MNESTDSTKPQGLRGWWASPPRSGIRLVIPPWDYRHPRFFAGLRITVGAALVGLGFAILSIGRNDVTTHAWTIGLLLGAAVNFLFASWLIAIARSLPGPQPARLAPGPVGAVAGRSSGN